MTPISQSPPVSPVHTHVRVWPHNRSMLKSWKRWAEIERSMAPKTIRGYEANLRSLRATVGPLRQATTEDIRQWLYAQGGSPATVAGRLCAVRSLYRFAVKTERMDRDPTASLDRPKVKRGIPRPVADLTDRLEQLDPEARTIAVFMVETGLRISEACSVDVALPVPDDLIVRGKGSKERVVPLSDTAKGALTALEGRVRLSPRTIQRRFQLVGFNPHRLRHTFASELAEADVDLSVIQDLLGHSSPATTRIYQRNSPARLRAGLERRRGVMPST